MKPRSVTHALTVLAMTVATAVAPVGCSSGSDSNAQPPVAKADSIPLPAAKLTPDSAPSAAPQPSPSPVDPVGQVMGN